MCFLTVYSFINLKKYFPRFPGFPSFRLAIIGGSKTRNSRKTRKMILLTVYSFINFKKYFPRFPGFPGIPSFRPSLLRGIENSEFSEIPETSESAQKYQPRKLGNLGKSEVSEFSGNSGFSIWPTYRSNYDKCVFLSHNIMVLG